MEIDEELTLKKIQIFLAFMRYGNLSKAAVEMQISNVSVYIKHYILWRAHYVVLYLKMKVET